MKRRMTAKRDKKTGLILTYFFFSAATLANLVDTPLAAECPQLGEAKVPWEG